MKKSLSLIILVCLLFSLCSCDKYVSSYSALGLVRNQSSHSAEATFNSLDGELVFKLKKSDKGDEGNITYSLQVEKGEVYLYYDIYDVKEELAHAEAGETLTDKGGYIEGGHTVYIIIDAKDAKGKVSVELD